MTKPIYPGLPQVKTTERKEEFDEKGVSKYAKCPDCGRQLNRVYVKKGLMKWENLPFGYCLSCLKTFSIWWGRLPREVR